MSGLDYRLFTSRHEDLELALLMDSRRCRDYIIHHTVTKVDER